VLMTVGIADMKVSADPESVIITHALGSCLGIAIYDPVARVGGLLHAMLPDSSIDPRKAADNPFIFIDTGVPRLFRDAYAKGGEKGRIIVKVAGGATSKARDEEDFFQIGKRNFVMLRKVFWKNNVLIKAHDVGGCGSRTMSLYVGTGDVRLKASGQEKAL
jgi:chemotaxis protein CheD